MKLEYYRGGPVGFGTTTTTGEWVNLTTDSPDIQTGGARGVFGGNGGWIDYITISSTGNAITFGSMTDGRTEIAGLSSRTRGVFGGGYAAINTIEYVTITSTGNAQDFGDLTVGRSTPHGASNSTRGIFSSGYSVSGSPVTVTNFNIIDYITIASTGNAVDFGDTTIKGTCGSLASSTRVVFGGAYLVSTVSNTMEFITISTLGNSADFGDLTAARTQLKGCSNTIRGVFSGGDNNIMDYITISTLGNAIDFGDSSLVRRGTMSTSSSTRGINAGGIVPAISGDTNVIEYFTIMTAGNALDFGDLSVTRRAGGACSNGHGGLG
jgi:hypothetical protein